MKETLISSQRFLDDAIISEKIATRDFVVHVSPAFEIDGELFRTIQDGHHSFAAAEEAGEEPEYVEQSAGDNDRIGLLDADDIDTFLEASYIDSNWYDVKTGREIF